VRSVLITGTSTGIGRAAALRLDREGWRVFAGVRKEADAASLRREGSESLEPVIVDVADAAQIEAALDRVTAATGGSLDALVNNAGIGVPGPLETLPIEDFRRQIEVNLIAHVAVTQQALPALRKARGRVVFISSIGGRIAFPMGGAYHAAKFGIEAVGDVFRQELRRAGISVSIVEPGSISTEIWDRSDREIDAVLKRSPRTAELYGDQVEAYREASRKLDERGIAPEKVAEAIASALTARRPKTRYLVGADARLQARVKVITPARIFDRIVARALSF
jgi:NAD(P)-dependent dehydrogenase (short-subunit alcohol dehydrogenase family)